MTVAQLRKLAVQRLRQDSGATALVSSQRPDLVSPASTFMLTDKLFMLSLHRINSLTSVEPLANLTFFVAVAKVAVLSLCPENCLLKDLYVKVEGSILQLFQEALLSLPGSTFVVFKHCVLKALFPPRIKRNCEMDLFATFSSPLVPFTALCPCD
ncbi:hypothetical protein PR048_020052 [Dryococelus australis]|uniref:Uncharacterized protein n=1 Tax=Dryococelus australis TaxID=614101 RepID=A0ABQ9H591_9NEOP|nr:hypothetical protein PR048_020052 [Dryococelus australis]